MSKIQLATVAMTAALASQSWISHAQATSRCESGQVLGEDLMVLQNPRNEDCSIAVMGDSMGTQISRYFSVNGEGTFAITDWYGEGKGAKTTGSRIFYIFPRSKKISANYRKKSPDSDESVLLTAASGHQIRISQVEPGILGACLVEGGDLKINPFSPTHQGILARLRLQSSLVLDLGFKLGLDAYVDQNRFSTFRDPNGKECRVKNREIFDYPRLPGHPEKVDWSRIAFKFSDRKLADFLKGRCRNLDISVLRKTE